jgi:hypothetical protein
MVLALYNPNKGNSSSTVDTALPQIPLQLPLAVACSKINKILILIDGFGL